MKKSVKVNMGEELIWKSIMMYNNILNPVLNIAIFY